jgi:hypothetical protein
MHDPIMQVEAEQATAAPYAPLVVQVRTPLSMHVVVPGAHVPVHMPLTHAWPEHVSTGESETRSAPHWTTVVALLHTWSPGAAVVHAGSVVTQMPCWAPEAVSQSCPVGQIPFGVQVPLVQTSA